MPLDFDAGSASKQAVPPKELYKIRLPAIKLSGLERAAPVASIVRSGARHCGSCNGFCT